VDPAVRDGADADRTGGDRATVARHEADGVVVPAVAVADGARSRQRLAAADVARVEALAEAGAVAGGQARSADRGHAPGRASAVVDLAVRDGADADRTGGDRATVARHEADGVVIAAVVVADRARGRQRLAAADVACVEALAEAGAVAGGQARSADRGH